MTGPAARAIGARLALLGAVASLIGCGGHVYEPANAHDIDSPPVPITDAGFTFALHDALLGHDHTRGPRLGVARQALAHASERFRRGDDDRALATVLGSLYLLRPGDRAGLLVDNTTIGAIDGALRVVSARGDVASAKFFAELSRDARRAGRIPDSTSADLSDIDRHLDNMEAFEQATKDKTTIEMLGATERSTVRVALLDPSREHIEQAREAIGGWIDVAIDHNIRFKQTGKRPSEEEAIEATRALESGPVTIVALDLRAGDLDGAIHDIDASSARRIIDPGFYRSLHAAADRNDGSAWRSVFSKIDQATSERGGEIGINEDLLGAAFMNIALEAYRRDKNDLATATELSRSLSNYGLGEAVPLVLADGIGDGARPEDAAIALRVFLATLEIDRAAGDDEACLRAIATADPLLAIAGPLLRKEPQIHPQTSEMRADFAEIQAHAGALALAKQSIDAANADGPTSESLFASAQIERQLGNTKEALEAITKATSVANLDPLVAARAELVVYEIHRAANEKEDAAHALELAVRAALEARKRAYSNRGTAADKVTSERVLGSVLHAYGEDEAAGHAYDRALEQARGDRALVSEALRAELGFCFLVGDVDRAHAALDRGRDAGATTADLVRAAAWSTLVEARAKRGSDGKAAQVLGRLGAATGFARALANWAVGALDDGALVAAASTEAERTEATFYVAARAFTKGAEGSAGAMAAVAKAPVLGLVVVDVARYLGLPTLAIELPRGLAIP